MKYFALLYAFLISWGVFSQSTISGTFAPAEDYKWLIAYRLEPGSQAYAGDTAIKDGEFSLDIPADAPSGMYRIVYAVPQEQFFFDVLYDGEENVNVSFDAMQGVSFTSSKNNGLYRNYFKEIHQLEQKIIASYEVASKDNTTFLSLVQSLETTQEFYEKESDGQLVHNFIVANRPYIPLTYETLTEYIQNRKQYYFKSIDFADPVLQKSSFLKNKASNYIFTALPMKEMDLGTKERELQKNLEFLETQVQNVGVDFKIDLWYTLWQQLAAIPLDTTADFLYETYLQPLAEESQRQDIVETIETHNRLRLGAPAPEITWVKDAQEKKLSSLAISDNYVLVFWSSGCSHCLEELPKLHEAIKDYSTVKVIAVGLEDDSVSWEKEVAKMTHFEHAISLGKWESKYAKLYDIMQTPTYFILDGTKKIVAKPENYEALLTILDIKK